MTTVQVNRKGVNVNVHLWIIKRETLFFFKNVLIEFSTGYGIKLSKSKIIKEFFFLTPVHDNQHHGSDTPLSIETYALHDKINLCVLDQKEEGGQVF